MSEIETIKKFIVITSSGSQASAPDNEAGAQATAAAKNAQALALGVTADYQIREATEAEVKAAQPPKAGGAA